MRTGGDEQAAIPEVTTSVSGRKRGRPPLKPLIKIMEESDTGRVTDQAVWWKGRVRISGIGSDCKATAQWKGRVKSCDIGDDDKDLTF